MRTQYTDPFETWQTWFAWRPIWIGYMRVWWEPVERRLKMFGYDTVWEYRLLPEQSKKELANLECQKVQNEARTDA